MLRGHQQSLPIELVLELEAQKFALRKRKEFYGIPQAHAKDRKQAQLLRVRHSGCVTQSAVVIFWKLRRDSRETGIGLAEELARLHLSEFLDVLLIPGTAQLETHD